MTKDDLLELLRRTAAENGGVPLGADRLAKLGVTEGAWRPYWPRLSDAQRAAGLQPNVRKAAFDDDAVLQRLSDLARSIGAFPTGRERVIARKHDPTFPSERVFRRMGSKTDLVSKLVAHAHRQGGLEDVLALCRAQDADLDEAPSTGSKRDVAFGTVYLLKGPGRRFKIGRTNAFGRRQRELSIQLPFETRKVHVIETDDPEGVESYWHRRFDDRRINSEWFELGPDDVAAFKRWRRLR